MNLFEIFLRNVLNYHVSSHFVDPEWIINQRTGFMSHPSLAPDNFKMRHAVNKARAAILRKGAVVTSGKVIAEQTFGFWTSLFQVHHYSLIGGSVIHAFPNKPPIVNRTIVAQKLNDIREFRNRIYHNEPICFAGNLIDFSRATQIRQDIVELLMWMDADLVDYFDYFDAIPEKIALANHI